MRRYTVPILVLLAMMSAFWACVIMDSLITEFAGDITWVDLAAVFVLGLMSGIALGVALAFRRRQA
jgi:hypothetical protein